MRRFGLLGRGWGRRSERTIFGVRSLSRSSLVVPLVVLGWLLSVPAFTNAAPLFVESFDGSGTGVSFSHPTGMAVDQSSPSVFGNVLLADGGSSQAIDVFGPEGGMPAGGAAVQLSHSFAFGEERAAVAIDDAAGSASQGDVYVADTINKLVEKFRLNGSGEYEYLCEFTGYGSGCQLSSGVASEAFGEVTGVAVDAHSNVYVSDYSNDVIDEFDAEGADVRQLRGSAGDPLGHPAALALDSHGDLFVAQYEEGEPVLRFAAGASGEVEPGEAPTVLAPGPAYGVAADRANDTVYVVHATRIAQYNSSGAAEGESEAGPIGQATGIAVSSASGRIYVSDTANDTIDVFAPPPPLPPTVIADSEFSKGVAASSAELGAQVNPNYSETRYYFQYGTDLSYAAGATPTPPGIDIGAAGGAAAGQGVKAVVRGLLPGVTYHYRVVAVNANGITDGPDRTFTTFAGGPVALADGRAWEMVSPFDKNGGGIAGIDQDSNGGIVQATPEGDAITYVSLSSFADPQGAPAGSQYLSTRAPADWSTRNITIPLRSDTYYLPNGTPYKAFSSELSRGLLPNGEESKPIENSPLVPGAPQGYENLYLRDIGSGATQAALTSKPEESAKAFFMIFEGATPDLRHVVVASAAALTAGAVSEAQRSNLYEWADEQLQAVNILPGVNDGATVTEAELGSGRNESNSISADGSRVFWSYHQGAERFLYVRKDGLSTVRLDASQGGLALGEGEHQFSQFQTASTDGSRAFFTSNAPLTSEANTGPPCGTNCSREGHDLYQFDVNTGALADLTPDHNGADTNGADVLGVLGASDDGSYVYFVATGVLTVGANAEGRSPSAGADNLYVEHLGTTRFIATLSSDDEQGPVQAGVTTNDWAPQVGVRTARAASDGLHATFMSDASLTGYDNTDALSGRPDEEVYVYDASLDALVCASCNTSGERPVGSARIPGGTGFDIGGQGVERALYQSRVLSSDGSRVFFDSSDALAPQDTNGRQDVYEWEQNGVGSCRRAGGCTYLLSGGLSSEDSSFVDASANGEDVFFVTRQQLVGQDTDQLVDLYDARAPHVPGEQVDFSAPPPTVPCEDEDCRPAVPVQPLFGSPASAQLGGSGNLTPPVSRHVKAKPKKKSKARKKAKAKGRHARQRAARRSAHRRKSTRPHRSAGRHRS